MLQRGVVCCSVRRQDYVHRSRAHWTCRCVAVCVAACVAVCCSMALCVAELVGELDATVRCCVCGSIRCVVLLLRSVL